MKLLKMLLVTSLLSSVMVRVHADTPSHCLAETIYYEARGEGAEGMIAVGQVVLNRVEDGRFPDTICDVVYQPHQFSWVDEVRDTHYKKDRAQWMQSLTIAQMLLHPERYWFINLGATNYVNKRLHGKLKWTREYKMVDKIGNHYFYVWN